MKPRKPLPRSTKPIRARKADKSKRRFANLRDEAYQGWIRQQSCVLHRSQSGCPPWGYTVCAHVKARGAGGADRGNVVPMCVKHHSEQHEMGIKSFQKYYGLDLAAIADRLDAQYREAVA